MDSRPWYKNHWFLLAVVLVVGIIGSLNGPADSTAAPATLDPAPATATIVAPAVELAPIIEPAPSPPITNNNIILIGGTEQDAQSVIESLPSIQPTSAPLPPVHSPEVRTVKYACLDERIAHHRRVAEWYEAMR